MSSSNHIPVIDISPFLELQSDKMEATAKQLHDVCRTNGFFYVKNHGISELLQKNLETTTRAFFDLPKSEKLKISMEHGGTAIRGYFPLGGELTSGKPDLKEGIYFGTEDQETGLAMHGKNQWPELIPEMQPLVDTYMSELKLLGDSIMRAISLSLDLPINYFEKEVCANPFLLLRAFHYPSGRSSDSWGVGTHTDYGLLTILKQDEVGGLQIHSRNEWIDAPCLENTFICNIGDMLDRMTNGYFRSTQHRVRNSSNSNRLTFPFFYDPGFHSKPRVIPQFAHLTDNDSERWDGVNVYEFEGEYGDYITKKVQSVFPLLT